jgi:hypothetical protein
MSNTIPTTRPIEIPLSGADKLFDYSFAFGEEAVGCASSGNGLLCDITTLALNQGGNVLG